MDSSSQDGITLLDYCPSPIAPLVLADATGVVHNCILDSFCFFLFLFLSFSWSLGELKNEV